MILRLAGSAASGLIGVLGLVLITAGSASSAITDGRRVALVVGNGAYEAVPALGNPARDAALIAEKLRAVGFEVELSIDGTQSSLERSVRAFGHRARGADAALFYYAGHGIQSEGRNYLLPVDANLTRLADLKYETLSLSLVMEELDYAGARVNLVVLDACRDNPLTRSLRRKSGTRAVNLEQGLASVERASGTFIAYATAPGDVAYDGEGTTNSPFTSALADWIEKPGLEIALMFRRVREQVVASTGGRQTPWVEEAILGDFYFRPDAGPATVAVPANIPQQPTLTQPSAAQPPALPERQPLSPMQDTAGALAAWSSARKIDTREAYKTFLQLYPNSVYAQDALTLMLQAESNVPSTTTPAPAAASQTTPPAPKQETQPTIQIIEGNRRIPNLY